MAVITYEGVVENGQIRLKQDIHLPERATVYVVVPEAPPFQIARLVSPRLAHPEQVADFRLEVTEPPDDAGV